MKSVIKNSIRLRIETAKLEPAIKLFKLVAPHHELVNSISGQLARLKKSEKDHMASYISEESHRITLTNITSILLNEINNLPEDIELLRGKLKVILIDYSVITDSIELINYLVNDDTIKFHTNQLSNRLYNAQQTETDNDQVTWEEDIERAEKTLENIIDGLVEYQLDLDWAKKFIYWLENSQTEYFHTSSQGLEHEYLSSYYPLINKISQDDENYEIKGILYNWLEKYLVGEFDKAYDLLIDVRDQKGTSNPIFYEFIAIAFVNQSTFEKKLKNVLVKGDLKEFKRLLFYIERYSESSSEQVTQRTTIYVLEKISKTVKNVYLNIAHNYFQDGTRKGRSKQREIIKRCIEVFIQVGNIQGITEYGTTFENLRTLFIIELDNSGKFPWTEIKNDKLVNTTVFDAVEKRNHLLNTLPDKKSYVDKLLVEVKMKIIELEKNDNLHEDAINRFLICCMIAHYNYQDARFIGVIRDLKVGNRIKTNINSEGLEPQKTALSNEYELDNFLHKFGIIPYEVPEDTITSIATIVSIIDEMFLVDPKFANGSDQLMVEKFFTIDDSKNLANDTQIYQSRKLALHHL